MISWSTNKEVNNPMNQEVMRQLREKYLGIVGIDNLSDYKEYELPRIIRAIFSQQGTRILDFGTGMSCLPAYIALEPYEVWCVDDGSWHPEVNEKSYNKVFKSKVKYVIADILKDPMRLPNNYFDVIYSASALEHINEPEKYIEVLNKKLKKGGTQIHIVDFDEVHHPVDFNKIIKAMGLNEELPEEPEDVYMPIKNIGRICLQK